MQSASSVELTLAPFAGPARLPLAATGQASRLLSPGTTGNTYVFSCRRSGYRNPSLLILPLQLMALEVKAPNKIIGVPHASGSPRARTDSVDEKGATC